ncbi:MAG: shikimate kinase [Oscillospiraceae bacterium]|nr:shikimate kinase [Oscillospiraceae bacterium]
MKKNIVLIGMPGCGKSAVGRELATLLHMVLVDTDQMVEQADGRTIADIFAQEGEAAFRDKETAAAKRASSMEGVIIATGGGMVLQEENMQALQERGIVFFRDRAPGDILGEDLSDRPLLSGDKQRIYHLYEQRIGLYRKYAHYTISDTHTAKEAAARIAAIYKKECGQ